MAACGVAHAQQHTFKGAWCGMTRTPKTNGGTGTGIPPGADATVGDATTVVFTYQYEVKPNVGIEWVPGTPRKVQARATGSVAFLDPVLTAATWRNVAPTVFVTHHFGQAGDRLRPCRHRLAVHQVHRRPHFLRLRREAH